MDESNNNPTPNVVNETGDSVEEDMDESIKLKDSSSKKNEKSTTSECWKYFTRIRVGDDGKERARCNSCNKKYIIGGQKSNALLI